MSGFFNCVRNFIKNQYLNVCRDIGLAKNGKSFLIYIFFAGFVQVASAAHLISISQSTRIYANENFSVAKFLVPI